MKKFLIIFGIIALTGCDSPSQHTSDESPMVELEEAKPNWTSGTNTDKMDGKITKYTYTDSKNLIDFEFPYNGGSQGTIVVFNSGGVKFMVNKGQLICNNWEGCQVRIKIDNRPPKQYTFCADVNYNSERIWMCNGSNTQFIKELAGASKVMVEPEFFQAGNKVYEFDVEGFVNPK
jgi:hypothetical protein